MNSTPRLALPFLSAGQAQKELFHNDALQTLDVLVGAAVEELPRNSPPSSPVVGACYLISTAPTEVWAGKPQYVAAFTSGGWRFVAPREGMLSYVRSSGTWAAYRAGSWEIGQLRGSALVLGGKQVVGSRAAAIPGPAGGTTIDVQARSAVDQVLAVMRQHGLIET